MLTAHEAREVAYPIGRYLSSDVFWLRLCCFDTDFGLRQGGGLESVSIDEGFLVRL